eukprot:gene9123-10096_t
MEEQHLIHSQSVPILAKHGKSWTRSHSDSDWKDTWKGAIVKAKGAKDPWAKYKISETCDTEKALRYRYNTFEKKWVRDEIEVKMQPQVFGRGAMRKCFRTKKLSTFSQSRDWKHASNYVAKRYIEDIPNKMYFDDVKVQMDAKVWAEEYNRHNPPKKVDIFQVYIIEMIERQGSPLFHFEHFIEGNYVKYNSNSGFVLTDDNFRMTPQAFSHFTFERSGHHLIVVDIQGVGDLYTDPQIHTACGTGYGEANLGPRGMALFFGSHKCNKICKDLGLATFDLSPLEERRIDEFLQSSNPSTQLRETYFTSRRKMSAMFDLVEKLSDHGSSQGYGSDDSESIMSFPESIEEITTPRSVSDDVSSSCGSYQEHDPIGVDAYFARFNKKKSSIAHHFLADDDVFQDGSFNPSTSPQNYFSSKRNSDSGFSSQSDDNANFEKLQDFNLGLVHLELVTLNQVGRFTQNEPDLASAFFHLEIAASCRLVDANREIGKIYMQLPHDILENYNVEESDIDYNKGISYLMLAAKEEDRECMLIVAKSFDTGDKLGNRIRSWPEAIRWYEEVLKVSGTDYEGLDDNPAYKILARIAEMYREGGYGLEKDLNKSGELYNEAGEAAMNAMKGKMSNKYYMLAEEVWGEIEE